MANANASRPNPWVLVTGVRKKPKVERGPNAMAAIRHPKRMMMPGVLQVVSPEGRALTVMP